MSESTSSEPFDMVVIGGGSAGYAAASQGVQLGLRVAVVEGAEHVGGLCILRGCMPSKTFLESAHRADSIRRAAEFGLRAEYHGADGVAIQQRKQRLIREFAEYREQQLMDGRFTFLRGRAEFQDAHTVLVQLREGGERQLSGRTFVLATGSRIQKVLVPGLEETGYLTSDEVLDATTIPQSVIMLGAGATGVEFASYYNGLGTKVTIVQRSCHLLKSVDLDVANALTEALCARGVQVHCGTELLKVSKHGTQKRVYFKQGGTERMVEAEEIVYALGRSPNTAGLNLAAAGVELRKADGPVRTDSFQQTSAPHIFAAGDVCGPYEVVHIAVQQAELAARNAARLLGRLGGALEEMDYRLKMFVVFSHPEVATVGLTTEEAEEQGLEFVTASYPFNDHGKSLVQGETHGFVKLLAAGPERRLIGGAVIGPGAAELIHEIVVALRFNGTAQQLATTPHYHPTLSEIWTYPAEALAAAPPVTGHGSVGG